MVKTKEILDVVGLGLLVKLLLLPAYFSTDFDVHRNWLRITYNQPITNWYTDAKSQWTLDYPPLFAYFQYLLAVLGSVLCPDIVSNDHLQCHSMGCVTFQRGTVIASQFVYLAGILYCLKEKATAKRLGVLFLQYGFVLLDDVHFQYNSMMQGILLFSIQFILQGRILLGAFTFSTLLNLKHIYIYVAPIYFIYIISFYVLRGQSTPDKVKRLIKVGTATLLPFIIAFGPFVVKGGTQQVKFILGRLFPFGRGLVHSYWAPNFWALYCALDRVLGFLFLDKGYLIEGYRENLRVLPAVSPFVSLLLVTASSVLVYKKCFQGGDKLFVKHLVLGGLLFCFFGFHVHQKAFLVYINLALLFGGDMYWNEVFVNSVSLMPLLFRPLESVTRVLGLALYMWYWRESYHRTDKSKFVVATGSLLIFYNEVLHPFTTRRYYFMPLMMYSLWATFFNTLTIGQLFREVLEDKGFRQEPDHEYLGVDTTQSLY